MKTLWKHRSVAALIVCALLGSARVAAQQSAPAPAAPRAATTVQVNRAARDTWTPLMDVLKASRDAPVTDAQLQRLRDLPLEAIWGSLQRRNYVRSFEGGFQQTVPHA